MMRSHQRAWLLYERSKYDLAEKEVGQALARQPDDPEAHAIMALCLLAREKNEEATEHARQAVTLDPTHAFHHYVLSRIWSVRNYVKEAETAIREALRLQPHHPAYHAELGWIRYRQSDWNGALAAAEDALAIDPGSTEALNLRAQALRKLGRRSTAEEELEEALRLEPENPWTHANLGWNYLEKGDRAGAEKHFREALRLDPDLDWARHGALETIKTGNALYRAMFRFFTWMRSLGSSGQWKVILGAWLVYIIGRQIAAASPALAPWLWPLLVAYLVFVLATWFVEPLANLTLRLHPFGRLALSRDERIGSNWVGGFLLGTVLLGLAALATGGQVVVVETLLWFAAMLLAVAATVRCASPWPRSGMIVYAIVLACLGLIRLGILLGATLADPGTWPPLLAAVCGLALRPLTWAFYLGAGLSLFGANLLASIRWKQ